MTFSSKNNVNRSLVVTQCTKIRLKLIICKQNLVDKIFPLKSLKCEKYFHSHDNSKNTFICQLSFNTFLKSYLLQQTIFYFNQLIDVKTKKQASSNKIANLP